MEIDSIDNVAEYPVIVVFANYQYARILENWIAAISRLGISNYMVVALDVRLHDYLKNNGVKSVLRECDEDLGNIWVHRVKVIQELLESGYDVIHSDADAVWLKNPLDVYFHKPAYDVAFSQGTHWPRDVHNVWGFVLCCGLFYVRSNDATRQLFDAIAADVECSKDDQVSCNRVLMKLNTEWEYPNDMYSLSYDGIEFNCSNEIIHGKNNVVCVALLPHSRFQRISDSCADVYIKHMISSKTSCSTKELLKNNNCWFLD